MFNGVYCGGSTATVTLEEEITLKTAKEKLLSYYQSDRTDNRQMYSTWATILRHDSDAFNLGGLFGYWEDGYTYKIEESEN